MKSVRAGLLLAAAIILVVPLGAQEVEIVGGRKAVAHEALVKFRREAGPLRQFEIGRQYGIQEMRALNPDGVVHMRSARESAAGLIARLSADPDVLYAEPNYLVNVADDPATTLPNDPDFPMEWGLRNNGENGGIPHADIDAVAAWTITTGSPSVVVGVVDTGIDYTHPDLQANIWSAPAPYTITFAPGHIVSCPAGSHGFDAILETCDPMDQENHGTHVAGTIGAVGNNGIGGAGVNWNVTMIGIRFLDASGTGTTANAIRAIEAAIQIKAAFPAQANIQILSNSWGGPGYSQALEEEVTKATDDGMLFVAAAGNNGVDLGVSPEYPAAFGASNEISVAATDNRDGLAAFSNYSSTLVDMGAPGVNILSTIRGGQYEELSGTSMATPHVSGAAALVLSVCSLSTSALKQTLLATADPIPALAAVTVTGSRLNAYRAVHSCAGQSTSPSFTLTATPSVLTLSPGHSAVSVVAVAGNGGFKSDVGFWVAGLPAGVSATFTPAVALAGGSTVLTLTASPDAAAINTMVTIWASNGGSLNNSFALVLSVTQSPGFTIAATPASQNVMQGYSGVIGISVAGNSRGVALQVSGLPPNTAAVYGEAASGGLTLTVDTTMLTPIGSYPITITGSVGSLQQSTTATLNVIK